MTVSRRRDPRPGGASLRPGTIPSPAASAWRNTGVWPPFGNSITTGSPAASPVQYCDRRTRNLAASVRTTESCLGSKPGVRPKTSIPTSDSFGSAALPARCCSTTKRRNLDRRSLRRNSGLARMLSNWLLTGSALAPVGSITFALIVAHPRAFGPDGYFASCVRGRGGRRDRSGSCPPARRNSRAR